MHAPSDLATDLNRPDKDGAPVLEPTYTAGLADGLGVRLICFPTPGATSQELLRFSPELADAPGFEDALRASVEALGRLNPSLATVRSVERMDDIEGLALVSVRETGKRLSELMPRARGTAYAIELLHEIGPALALLHEAGHAHGALTPERIIISREGRPIVLEHVVGAALGALALSAARLRSVAGIAVPDTDGPPAIDARLDVLQLGFIALSLVVGRRLHPTDYPGRIAAPLDEYSRTDPEAAAVFRPWLERALQTGGRPFARASEALVALSALPDVLPPKPAQPPAAVPVPARSDTPAPVPDPDRDPVPRTAALQMFERPSADFRRIAFGLGTVVVLQTAIIGYLLVSGRPDDATIPAVSSPPPVGAGAFPLLPVTGELPDEVVDSTAADALAAGSSASVSPPAAADVTTPEPTRTSPPAPAPAGDVTVVSPIELQVFEGGTLLGSTAGPFAVAAGAHTLDFVNEELGYRSRRTVNVRGGQMTPVTIAVPAGRIDINAVPWADVSIDGVAVGQTPLANLTLPIGRHEIVFRHPQLGERQEIAVVTVDGIARVSVVFQQVR